MRALYESIDRESELQRQLRRTKETLVSTALRLQVAIKMSQEDELTMTSLISQAEAAKAKEIIATRKVEEATDTINSLAIEVNSLKRRLRAVESERSHANSQSSLAHFDHINTLADQEVDAMFQQELKTQIPNYIDPVVANAATPFDRWKMNSFLFAPDTPAGSKAHDAHAVQMLLLSSTTEVSPDKMSRPTVTSIARSRRILTGTRGESPSSPTGRQLGSSAQFFLSNDPKQLWSHKPDFDRDNMGRLNLWASHKEESTLPKGDTAKSRLPSRSLATANPAMTSSGPVKLKSLRLPENRRSGGPDSRRSPSPPPRKSKEVNAEEATRSIGPSNRKVLV